MLGNRSGTRRRATDTPGLGYGSSTAPSHPPAPKKKAPLQGRADAAGCKCSRCTALLPAGPWPINSPVHRLPPTTPKWAEPLLWVRDDPSSLVRAAEPAGMAGG